MEDPLSLMDKIMCWNVRGLNQPGKQQEVKKMIASQQIGLVGLLETRVKVSKFGTLYLNLFQGWCFTTNIGWHKGGRIVVSWNPMIFNVTHIVGNCQFLHFHISLVDKKWSFLTTIVYAYNNEDGRRSLWAD